MKTLSFANTVLNIFELRRCGQTNRLLVVEKASKLRRSLASGHLDEI